MAQDRQGNILLDECITDYLTESEQGMGKYYKCFTLAFRAMTEMGFDSFYAITSVKLPVLPNKTVPFPNDYGGNFTKIGVLNSKGEIIPLYYNPKLTTYADFLPNRIGSKTQDPTLSTNFNTSPNAFNNYWYDGYYSTYYGLPSGSPFVGNYKLDTLNNLIVLDEAFYYDYLMVEYVACPNEKGEYYVPMVFKEAIISYLRWKDNISMPSKTHVNESNINMRRKDFYNERRLAIARYKPFYPQVAYQMNMDNERLTVKT